MIALLKFQTRYKSGVYKISKFKLRLIENSLILCEIDLFNVLDKGFDTSIQFKSFTFY